MCGQLKTEFRCDFQLPLFDQRITELADQAAADADHMIVMLTLIKFIARVSALEVITADQASRFELGQYPINSRQANGRVIPEQQSVDLFRAQVLVTVSLQNSEDFTAGLSGFEAGLA